MDIGLEDTTTIINPSDDQFDHLLLASYYKRNQVNNYSRSQYLKDCYEIKMLSFYGGLNWNDSDLKLMFHS